MNYTQINLDLQSVMKRTYLNLLYRSSFMNFLNPAYLGALRQGTPRIEVIKQKKTTTNVELNKPILEDPLNPELAQYDNGFVDLTELRLDYSFRIPYLVLESGIQEAVTGQINLQDSENSFLVDQYGYNKFNGVIIGASDGSEAEEKGQVVEYNPTTKEEIVAFLNNLKMQLFNRKIYDGYMLGLEAIAYGEFVSAMTTVLHYETLAGVEGVDRGDIANIYGISVFPIVTTALTDGVKGYFGSNIATIGDAFYSRWNEWNGDYQGFPGDYVCEGIATFGALVVRPEGLIKLVSELSA